MTATAPLTPVQLAAHNTGRSAYHGGQCWTVSDNYLPEGRRHWLQGWMAAATETANEAEVKAIAAGRQPDPWAHGQRRA